MRGEYAILKNKFFIFNSIILILGIFLLGCDSASELTENNDVIQESEIENISTTEADSTLSEKQQNISFNDLPDDIKGCIIPMDSLMLYHVETGKEYDSTDAYMFWRTMHFALGNFGVNYNRAEITDYELEVESMVIGEFATSFIPDFDNPPPIPEELSDFVRYDDNSDTYYFGLGDRGLSQTEILSYEYVDNNTLKITARLFGLDDDSTICRGEFVLKRNDYASGVVEPLFYFTVTEVEFSDS